MYGGGIPGLHHHQQQKQQQRRRPGNFNLIIFTGFFTLISSQSILDLVSPQLELDMDTSTSTTILAMAMGSMPTRDIMEDTMAMLVTTTEVTAMFLRSLSMVGDITLTTGTTNKNEKSLHFLQC